MGKKKETGIAQDITDIIQSNQTISQKINCLEELNTRVDEEIEKAIQKIKTDTIYCKKCKEYYKASAYHEEIKEEMRTVCTFWPLAEFDDPEYATKLCQIKYITCPCGHIEEHNLGYRF